MSAELSGVDLFVWDDDSVSECLCAELKNIEMNKAKGKRRGRKLKRIISPAYANSTLSASNIIIISPSIADMKLVKSLISAITKS